MQIEKIRGKVDFGIIAIREDEFRAVLQRFPPDDLVKGERAYTLSQLKTKAGEDCVVASVRTPEQGEGEAQNTARDMIEDLDPDCLMVVGISGAVPSKEFTLGDVVLATRLHDFSLEARIQDEQPEYGITGGPMHKLVQDYLAILPAYEVRGDFYGWNDDDAIGMSQPPVSLDSDNFYGDAEWIRKTRRSLESNFGSSSSPRQPRLTTGSTASSDRLIKDTQILETWRKTARYIINIEMELGGVYRAARRSHREYPILAVRGLSDVVGFKRDDNWTEYACQAAASFAHALIRSGQFPKDPNRSRDRKQPAPPIAEPSPAKALEELRLASSIAAADATLVVREEALGGDVCLDQDLYVVRNVEERVLRNLEVAAESRKPVLIVGEAGRGKTSLLWHLYDSLQRSNWEPWLIKSTMLVSSLRTSEKGHELSSEVLLAAVSEAIDQNKRPLLLLDTIDLLLHDEPSRDFLLRLILRLQNHGCDIVATSRPQEVPRLNAVEYRRVTLINYEGAELEEAIRKHVRRFYSLSLQEEETDQVKEILESVARGLPLREVCENPLTLRMLFTIYSPSRVPADINVFELYKRYWSNRIESDLRAGNPFPPTDAVNAETAAEAVALGMLSERLPDIRYERAKRFVEQLGGTKENVDVLNSRGVLHHSGTGNISFFHQTFFEHSAARALLRYFPANAVALLNDRLEKGPDDLLTTPIYEQLLLLAEDADIQLRKQAEGAIIHLFETKSLSSLMSGLYVHCHRREVSPVIERAAQKVLIEGEEAIQIRFLELALNIPAARLPKLFEDLDLIWSNSTSRVKEHLIELLRRLVPRQHSLVEKFFDRHKLIDYVFGQPPPFNIGRDLLDIIEAIALYNSTWGWRYIVEFCRASVPKTKGRELPIAAVRFLQDKSSLFEPREIATRFESDTSSFMEDRGRDFHELSAAIGELWAIEWRESRRSVSDILSEISGLSEGMKLVTRMKGLAVLLRSASDKEASSALDYFDREEDYYKRSVWIEYVLPAWLQALGSEDRDARAPRQLQEHIATCFAAVDRGNESWHNQAPLVQAVRTANLSSSSFVLLIPPTIFSTPEPWLDEDQLAFLLVDAVVAGNQGAIKALALLHERPESLWARVAKAVGPSLVQRILVPELMDVFFKIVLKVEDVVQVKRALEELPIPSPTHFVSWHSDLSEFCVTILNTRKEPQKRRYAIMIWDELLRRGLPPAHQLDQLTKMLRSESDKRVRGFLVSIIGRSTAGMKYDLGKVLKVLEPLTEAPDPEVSRQARLAIAQAVTDYPGDISPYVMTVLNTAIKLPTNAEFICVLKPLIERLLRLDVRLAASLTQKLIMGAHQAKLGTAGRHKMFGRLKGTVRLVVRRALHEARQEMIKMVPDLDRVLGSLVVDAICHEALSELSPQLDALLASDVAGEIKEIILRYRYSQDRSLGGESWPELDRLLAAKIKTISGS